MGWIRSIIGTLLSGRVTIDLSNEKSTRIYKNRKNKDVYHEEDESRFQGPEFKSRKTVGEAVNYVCQEKGYKYLENVNVNIFGDEYSSKYKFTYLIVDQDDNIKEAVLVVPHNGERNRHFYELKGACAERNLPFVYFYEQMSNEMDYVVSRISEAL